MLQCLEVQLLVLGWEVTMMASMWEEGPSLDQQDSDWFPSCPGRDLTHNLCSELDAGLLGAGPASWTLWKTLLVQPLGWYLQSYMAQCEKAADHWRLKGRLCWSIHLLPYSLSLFWLCKCCSWNLFLAFEKLQALCMIYGIMWSYKSSATPKCNKDTVCIIICFSFAWPHLCQCWIAECLSNSCVERVTEKTPGSLAMEGDCPNFSLLQNN